MASHGSLGLCIAWDIHRHSRLAADVLLSVRMLLRAVKRKYFSFPMSAVILKDGEVVGCLSGLSTVSRLTVKQVESRTAARIKLSVPLLTRGV